MSHVRSVSLGVWLSRGSRHETDEESGIAHFVEHMLFKGTATRTAEDIAQAVDSIGGQLDAFTAKEYASYYVKVLDEHVPIAVDILSDIVLRPAFHGRRHRAREKSHPRRNQDGRGHARRSRARDFHAGILGRAPARAADPRDEGKRRGAHAAAAARPFPRRVCRRERDYFRRRQPRAFAAARRAREGVRLDAGCGPQAERRAAATSFRR